MHNWFLRRTGGRKGPATALTLFSTLKLVVIPALIGLGIVFGALTALSTDVASAMQEQEGAWRVLVQQIDEWLESTGVAQAA